MSRNSVVSCFATRKEFIIPYETHILHEKNWSHRSDQCVIDNTLNRPELHDQIRKLMISSFYREAPVPLALKLARNDCSRTRNFLTKEINVALNSGVSTVYTHPKTNSIISVALNLVWEQNEQYKVIGGAAKEWHNSASEIVSKDLQNNAQKHLEWRRYQFQHIYDLGQSLLRQVPEKKYALYLSTGYINPKFRRSSSSSKSQLLSRLDDYHAHWNLSDCIIYFATTFSKMDDHIGTNYPNYKPFDHIKYTDQDLVLGSKRCFQPFEHLGGMTYYVDFLTDFVQKY